MTNTIQAIATQISHAQDLTDAIHDNTIRRYIETRDLLDALATVGLMLSPAHPIDTHGTSVTSAAYFEALKANK